MPSAAASWALLPELRVSVEREVVGDEREVAGEERLEPASLAPVDDERLVPPEDPVVDEHELRSRRRGALEELAGGGDAAGELRHLVRADHLQARRSELREALDLEQLVGVADDLVPVGHRAILEPTPGDPPLT